MTDTLLVSEDLRMNFRSGTEELTVLSGIDLTVEKGEIVSIVGASGVGKSTLLHILGTLMRPTGGKVWIDGKDVFRMQDSALSRFRNKNIGFVFQFHHLLPEFTAEENVMLPILISGGSKTDAKKRAAELLRSVSLGDRLTHSPGELSGGEQQRVAVARALATSPGIVLADEPSGNLDDRSSDALHELIWEVRDQFGQAFVLVTHDLTLAQRADRQLRIHQGGIEGEKGESGP